MARYIYPASHGAYGDVSERRVLKTAAEQARKLAAIPLVLFDPTITQDSPIGSCLLKILQPIAGKQPIHLFVDRTDLVPTALLSKTKIPVPRRPVFMRAILYTLLSACAYLVSAARRPTLRIGSEGAFPFCQISYAQFCHRFFLTHHRSSLGRSLLRRLARRITHIWGAITEKLAFSSANIIVVPSRGLAREIESVYGARVRDKIQIIPNPIDVEYFRRPNDFSGSRFREGIGMPREALVLSFCALGNFERKGLRVILDAIAQLSDVAVHLIVIGGTPGEIREFAVIADALAIKNRIHFAGFQRDVRPYLWGSDAFVFPSAYETFCLACFQAAAAGVPLIVSPVSGVEDFIENGVNGWLVERTRDSVARAIREAALSPEKTAAMGREAQIDAQVYRTELFQARWLELIEKERAALIERGSG